MKVRIITGVICALIVIMLLVFTGLGYQGAMSIPMGAIAAIAAYEIMRVSKCKNKVLTVVSMIFAAIGPAYVDFGLQDYISVPLSVIIIVYVVALLIIMLKFYDTTKFEHVALAFFADNSGCAWNVVQSKRPLCCLSGSFSAFTLRVSYTLRHVQCLDE